MLAPFPLQPFAHKASPNAYVRRATHNDLAALVALEQASFALDRMSERQWRRHLGSLSADVLVAVRERRIVGAAVLFRRRGSDIARLYSIAIAASERGNGIGAILLDAVEQAAHRQGSRRLRLEVRSDNVAAQRLYESTGYRLFGAHRRYYEDGQDARRYEKVLSSND
ncbi:MAG: GNAT family N-acetyltransferase [Dokdonella sp.]